MAIFGKDKESKEEKEARKVTELLEKYGLENISDKDIESIRRILNELAGTQLMKTGSLLSGMKTEEQIKVNYLSALFEQNWIMIRQLDRIAKLLEK